METEKNNYDELMGLSIDELVQLGHDIEAAEKEREIEEKEQKRTRDHHRHGAIMATVRDHLPTSLRPFVKWGREMDRNYNVDGWSRWWNLAIDLELEDMAKIELRFWLSEINENDERDEEPSLRYEIERKTNRPNSDPAIVVFDCGPVLDDINDEWFLGYRKAGSFNDLAVAMKHANEIGDRRWDVTNDVAIKNKLEAAKDHNPEPIEKPEPAPGFEDALIQSIRGLIRAEINAAPF